MFSVDDFLGGRVKLKQLKNGYRATSDAVLLASAITPKPKQSVLEVGAGTGAVALCLAMRCPEISITGIDIQSEMLELAQENVQLNGVQERVSFVQGDIRAHLKDIPTGVFDFVITNPPFIQEDQVSPLKVKDLAHRESACSLDLWIKQSLRYVGPKGTFVMINRADRLVEILALLYGKLGGIRIVPIYTKQGICAKRVIVMGKKDCRSKSILEQGVVLMNSDGSRTQQGENIMRLGYGLFEA